MSRKTFRKFCKRNEASVYGLCYGFNVINNSRHYNEKFFAIHLPKSTKRKQKKKKKNTKNYL